MGFILIYGILSACRPRGRCAEASEPRRASAAGAVVGHSGRRRCHIAAAAGGAGATASSVMRQPRAPRLHGMYTSRRLDPSPLCQWTNLRAN